MHEELNIHPFIKKYIVNPIVYLVYGVFGLFLFASFILSIVKYPFVWLGLLGFCVLSPLLLIIVCEYITPVYSEIVDYCLPDPPPKSRRCKC
jgi:hypothetical protein